MTELKPMLFRERPDVFEVLPITLHNYEEIAKWMECHSVSRIINPNPGYENWVDIEFSAPSLYRQDKDHENRFKERISIDTSAPPSDETVYFAVKDPRKGRISILRGDRLRASFYEMKGEVYSPDAL